MEQSFTLIAELGLPVAGGLVMAYFIILSNETANGWFGE